MTSLNRSMCVSAFTGLCLAAASALQGQVIVNPDWESPSDTVNGTSPIVTGWTMSPAPMPNGSSPYTNNGQRDAFYNNTPGGRWSFWLQTFTQSGNASQIVPGVTAGLAYNFTSQMSFQDGTGPGMGYNAVTLANQTETPQPAPNTGDLYSYLALQYLDSVGNPVAGGYFETDIPAGSVTIYNQTSGSLNGTTLFEPYSVTGVAPAGATQVEVLIGWNNGGLDGNTGSQSAFADDATLTVVPEPSTLAFLCLGFLPLIRLFRCRP
jgi:hypothetical protein